MQGLGFDWLRFANMPLQIGDWATADTSTASSIVSTHYMRLTPSPLARYLWTGLQCIRSGFGTATISLETEAGVVVDAGFTLDAEIPRRTDGFVFDSALANLYPTGGGLISEESLVHSGWSVGVAAGTTARLLDVGAYQGQHLVVKLVLSGVRAYALMACEAYQREV
jgi:hypothetical protein